MTARLVGAACLGVAGVVLLRLGGGWWPVALLGGATVIVFAVVRTVPGVWAAFGLLLASALAAWLHRSHAGTFVVRSLLPWLVGLEVYGIATIAAVRAVREPVQISRRLLGAWLASTGALALGLAQSGEPRTAAASSALLAFGLLYKLGVIPAYAWAPMLIRHPAAPITIAGAVGMVMTLVILLVTLPMLGNADAGAYTGVALSAVTAPWALWQASRQWRSDRRCARTYAVVALLAAALLWLLTQVASP